jgi:hypothetical protein
MLVTGFRGEFASFSSDFLYPDVTLVPRAFEGLVSISEAASRVLTDISDALYALEQGQTTSLLGLAGTACDALYSASLLPSSWPLHALSDALPVEALPTLNTLAAAIESFRHLHTVGLAHIVSASGLTSPLVQCTAGYAYNLTGEKPTGYPQAAYYPTTDAAASSLTVSEHLLAASAVLFSPAASTQVASILDSVDAAFELLSAAITDPATDSAILALSRGAVFTAGIACVLFALLGPVHPRQGTPRLLSAVGGLTVLGPVLLFFALRLNAQSALFLPATEVLSLMQGTSEQLLFPAAARHFAERSDRWLVAPPTVSTDYRAVAAFASAFPQDVIPDLPLFSDAPPASLLFTEHASLLAAAEYRLAAYSIDSRGRTALAATNFDQTVDRPLFAPTAAELSSWEAELDDTFLSLWDYVQASIPDRDNRFFAAVSGTEAFPNGVIRVDGSFSAKPPIASYRLPRYGPEFADLPEAPHGFWNPYTRWLAFGTTSSSTIAGSSVSQFDLRQYRFDRRSVLLLASGMQLEAHEFGIFADFDTIMILTAISLSGTAFLAFVPVVPLFRLAPLVSRRWASGCIKAQRLFAKGKYHMSWAVRRRVRLHFHRQLVAPTASLTRIANRARRYIPIVFPPLVRLRALLLVPTALVLLITAAAAAAAWVVFRDAAGTFSLLSTAATAAAFGGPPLIVAHTAAALPSTALSRGLWTQSQVDAMPAISEMQNFIAASHFAFPASHGYLSFLLPVEVLSAAHALSTGVFGPAPFPPSCTRTDMARLLVSSHTDAAEAITDICPDLPATQTLSEAPGLDFFTSKPLVASMFASAYAANSPNSAAVPSSFTAGADLAAFALAHQFTSVEDTVQAYFRALGMYTLYGGLAFALFIAAVAFPLLSYLNHQLRSIASQLQESVLCILALCPEGVLLPRLVTTVERRELAQTNEAAKRKYGGLTLHQLRRRHLRERRARARRRKAAKMSSHSHGS